MDFRQLQYICAVAEHESITKAAQSLFISQPSLSHFIAKTEEELGVKLFDRSSSPISLTFAGERYVKDAKQILKINEQMCKQFRDISQSMIGRLRVGMPHERAAYMLPLIMPKYSKEFPGIEIQLYTAGGQGLYDALNKGQIDFMIWPYQVLEKGFASSHIYEEELLLIARKGQIRAYHLMDGQKNTVDLEKLRDERFIVLRKGHVTRTAVDLLFQEKRFTQPVLMETHSNITCLRLAATGFGLAIVPRMTTELAKCKDDYEVFSIGIPPVTWDVIAIYRANSYIGVAEKGFFDISKRIFEAELPL